MAVLAIVGVFAFVIWQFLRCGQRTSVLLIIMDTVRADHVGCYGYADARTPNLDKLAASGVLFKQAISAIPETGPSVSSILTGLYPRRHGARTNTDMLPEDNVTLAEILREHGYDCVAFWDTFPFLDLRVFQGFHYGQARQHGAKTVDQAVNEAIGLPLEWIKGQGSKPTFTLVHLYDAHMPYAPLERLPRTSGLAYGGPYDGTFETVWELWGGKRPIDEADVRHMRSLYDDEIAFVDACVGRLLDTLSGWKMDDNLLVVVVADHGEALGEHDYYFDHGDLVTDDQVHVPLIIRWPRRAHAGKVINRQVRTVDIVPTVLDALGLPPPSACDGMSVLPMLNEAEESGSERPAFSETDVISFRNPNTRGMIEGVAGKLRALRRDGFKAVLTPQANRGGHVALYDLKEDPGETRDIAALKPDVAAACREQLVSWLAEPSHTNRVTDALGSETRLVLESLGYIQ